MKEMNITTKVIICTYDELTNEDKLLVEHAKDSALKAYAPYSKFGVGAALRLSNNEIVCGNNQENVAYPSGLCAERVALFYAGATYPNAQINTLAIAAYSNGAYLQKPITPCGACRQVMIETEQRQGASMRVILYGTEDIYLIEAASELMPLQFNSL